MHIIIVGVQVRRSQQLEDNNKGPDMYVPAEDRMQLLNVGFSVTCWAGWNQTRHWLEWDRPHHETLAEMRQKWEDTIPTAAPPIEPGMISSSSITSW